jgi:carboxymethylenebutenolidase
MTTFIANPAGTEPRPAVLIIQSVNGVSTVEISLAQQLADEGYVVAVPDLLFRRPPCFEFKQMLETAREALSDSRTVEYLDRTIRHLRAQPYVDSDQPIGIFGFCMGGRISYLMAGTRPDIAAAGVFYGGGIYEPGDGPAPIELTSNIRCPVIILDGEKDERPSPAENQKTADLLTQHGVPNEVHIYPGVGHGFMSRGPSDATRDATSRMFGWLHEHLPTAAPVAAGR